MTVLLSIQYATDTGRQSTAYHTVMLWDEANALAERWNRTLQRQTLVGMVDTIARDVEKRGEVLISVMAAWSPQRVAVESRPRAEATQH